MSAVTAADLDRWEALATAATGAPRPRRGRDPMSADRLAEIKARADAATKGPWHWREGEPTSLVHVTSPRMHPWNILKAPDWGPTLADAEFIAAAREDVPWLVERVERLERWKAEALGILTDDEGRKVIAALQQDAHEDGEQE